MVLLYFWPYVHHVNVGHISLLISSGQSEGQQTYVSFWPGKDDGRDDMGIPAKPHTYEQDVAAEGATPTGRLSIPGLDEAAMKRTWKSLLASKPRYYPLRWNCAWTVKVLLDAGTGVDFRSRWADYENLVNTYGVWTPRNVFDYARTLKNSHSDVRQKRFDSATNSPSGLVAS